MLIPNIYLIVAGQIALIMVCLIAYLIYMLVSEENRWEEYTDKLKNKIRELQEYKDRFDIVSENLHKQMELTKELTQKVDEFDAQFEAKNIKIAEQENFISELQLTITELQSIIKELEEKEKLLDDSNMTITELKTQLSILEDQGAEFPQQINGLNITIENLETENLSLKTELTTATETISQFDQQFSDAKNNDFNLTIEGVDKQADHSNNQFDLINNFQSRYNDEINRLKKNYKNQKNIIDDLESALMSSRKDPSKPLDIDVNDIAKLKQMLSESNTVIEMLEGETDALQAEINQLMIQNEALAKASIEPPQGDNDENPVEDGLNAPEKDEIFFDVESNTDDVFFDLDEAPNATDNTAAETPNSNNLGAEFEQLQMQLDGANQMAMTMMMTSGDQGNIINFARNSIQFETLEDLAKGILETVGLFQVNGAIQLRGEEHRPLNISTYGQLSEQDISKITSSKSSNLDRFVENDSELLIQFNELSLLITDMPLDDNDKMGRIKDNMAIALELACSNLKSIESALKIKKNQKILNNVLKNTFETIQNVEKQFNEQNEITYQVINSLTGIISNPSMTKGMDPIYKDVFTSIIDDGKKKFDQIKETGIAIDENFADIVKRLGSKIN